MASFPINNAPDTLDMATVHSIMDDVGGLAKSCRYAVVITPPKNILNNGCIIYPVNFTCFKWFRGKYI